CERKQFGPESIVSVSHDLIHQMGNKGHNPFVTLHLYGCNNRVGSITADARLYDLEAGEIQFTDGGVFFDLPEARISRRVQGPKADFATWLRFQIELLNRLFRKHDTFSKRKLASGRESRVAHLLFDRGTWQRLETELNDSNSAWNRRSQYWGILEQELMAAAQLQVQMIEARLVTSVLDPETLKQALELSSPTFLEAYSEILNVTFGLELEVKLEGPYSTI
ncbi:hypothetical protein MJD09_27695, partial [bacterium]|nr:hypothetical protein [bacterium]